MKPIDVRKKVDFIAMPIELRGRQDRASIKNLRPSPDVGRMKRVVDPDGTVWAFSSPAKMRSFVKNRKALEAKSDNHYLSGREVLTALYD